MVGAGTLSGSAVLVVEGVEVGSDADEDEDEAVKVSELSLSVTVAVAGLVSACFD